MPVTTGEVVTTEFTGNTRGLDSAFQYVERATGRHLTKVENLYRDATGRLVSAQNAMTVKAGGGGLLSGLGGRLETALIGGVSGFIGGTLSHTILDAGSALIKYNATMEQTRIGFTTLLGSAEKADQHLKELEKFAAKTPFEFEDLTRASRRFLNMGLTAKDVIPIMTAVGDAVAAAGGNGETIDRVTTAIAQMAAKGKVSAEEINQLAEAGVGGWKILSDQLGKTNAEVIKLAEGGQISSTVFIEAFRRFSEVNFAGAMEKQSNTFLGAWSTIMDTLKMQGGKAFEPLFDSMSVVLVRIKDEMENLDLATGLSTAITGAGEAAGRAAYELGAQIGRRAREGAAAGRRSSAIPEIDPTPGLIAGAVKGIWDEVLGSETDLLRIPSLAPQSLTPDPMATNSIKIWVDGVAASAKKAGEVINGLQGQLEAFSDSSNEAATMQRLFAAGLKDTSDAIFQQAIGMARLLDNLERIKEEAAKASRESLDAIKDRAQKTASLSSQYFDALFAGIGDDSPLMRFQKGLDDSNFFADPFSKLQITSSNDYKRFLDELAKAAAAADPYVKGIIKQLTLLGQKADEDKAEKKRKAAFDDLLGSIRSLNNEVENSLNKDALSGLEIGILRADRALSEFSVGTLKDVQDQIRALARESLIGGPMEQAASLGILKGTIASALEAANKASSADTRKLSADEIQQAAGAWATYFQNQARADKQLGDTQHAEAYSRLLGDITGQLETAAPVTVRMRLEQALLTDATKSLTEADREYFRGLADNIDRQNEAARAAAETRRTMQEVARDISGIFMNTQEGLREGGIRGALESLGRDALDTIDMIERELLNSAILSILDPEAAAKGSQAGGIVGALTNKILQAIGVMPQASQDAATGNTLATSVNTDATIQNTIALQQLTMSLTAGAATGGATGGGGFWSGLLGGVVNGFLGGIGLPGFGGLLNPGSGNVSVDFDTGSIIPIGHGGVHARAMGGNTSPYEMYKINEHENEWLYMGETSGRVFNQRQMAAMQNQGGNITIVNNFNAHPQTGAFSKQSAEQAAMAFGAQMEHTRRRSNAS